MVARLPVLLKLGIAFSHNSVGPVSFWGHLQMNSLLLGLQGARLQVLDFQRYA